MVGVAQLVELSVVVRAVAGSNPVAHPIFCHYMARGPACRHPERFVMLRLSKHFILSSLYSTQAFVPLSYFYICLHARHGQQE